MQSGLSVGLSSLITLQRRLDTVAANVANQSTPGYRAEAITFSSVVAASENDSVAYAAAGRTFTDHAAGEIRATGNPLDIAISGNAWLGVQAAGGLMLSRDGRLAVSQTGQLQTTTGHPVLDSGGTPIVLDPKKGPPMIAQDGTISQGDQPVGTIGLYLVQPGSSLRRVTDSLLAPSLPAIPNADPNMASVKQGHLEGSNVESVKELTRLIEIQRTFDAVSSLVSMTNPA